MVEFNGKLDDGIWVIEFFSPTCYPCKLVARTLDELADEYLEVKFRGVDVSKNRELPTYYNILTTPTILIFNDGREVKRFTGFTPKEKLELLIKDLL